MRTVRSVTLGIVIVVLAIGNTTIADDDSSAHVRAKVGEIGGWGIASDGQTLVISRPSAGELVYWDSVKHTKVRSIEVEFAPNRLAFQGNTLFASVRGSSLVYALDAESGKVLTRFVLPGEPIEAMASHREKGPVFAANLNEEIFAIDPQSGAFKKTDARGTMLACDPIDGQFVLVGTNRPGQDFLEVQRNGRVDRFRLVTRQNHAAVFKHAVENNGLRLISANTNAAFGNGGSLAINHDGKRFAMAAGGGWRSLTDQRFHYVIAVFETKNMKTMVGQIELGVYPQTIAFHPALNLGAALRHSSDATIKLFKASSLTDRQTIKIDRQKSAPLKTHRLLFAGRGTTLVHHYQDTLTFIPLALSEEDRTRLESANK